MKAADVVVGARAIHKRTGKRVVLVEVCVKVASRRYCGIACMGPLGWRGSRTDWHPSSELLQNLELIQPAER